MAYTKENAKIEIRKIIDNFKANYQVHKRELEANTETKLVEPLFEALGWTKKHLNLKIEDEINKTDNQINKEVYKLWGITNKEKEIIEKSLK